MQLKDWQQINELFHSALEVKTEERRGFLRRACNGNSALLREVESLVSTFEQDESFLEEPTFDYALKVIFEERGESLIGKTIGQYRIMQLLGKGGMGEVYLAEDDKLNRKVALKFFSSNFVDAQSASSQLTREARAVASLEHPNVCPVYDVQEADGNSFIVMQYVEGSTLASLINDKPLELEQALELAEQIVSALTTAHQRGIIHRDIKPQNIIVTFDGHAKVLDFGLAKVIRPEQGEAGKAQGPLSQAKLLVGTVAYMSPEQLRAEAVDFRSDIFSTGVLLYEMVYGKNPHARASEAETISAVLTSNPSMSKHPRGRTRQSLNRVIHKCLEKAPAKRYQSASELLTELQRLRSASNQRIRLQWRTLAALAMLLLIFTGALFAYLRVTKVKTLVVIPLVNESADANVDYLGRTLSDTLINQLSPLSGLRVKALTSLPAKDELAAPQAIGRELNADAVLVEKIERQDERLILRINLINVEDGATLWQKEYEVNNLELLSLQNEIADRVVHALQLKLSSKETTELARPRTRNAESYKLYLLGRHYWERRDKENIEKAIEYFGKAIELDPLFAQAWAGLAQSYVMQTTVAYGSVPAQKAMTRAKAAAKKAIEIDDTLCEAHISLGVVNLKYEWNWKEAEAEFKRAIEINPDNSAAHYWFSNLLAATGRVDEAIAESEVARDLDPYSPLADMNLARAFYYARQYDRAVEQLNKSLKDHQNHVSLLYMLGFIYLQKGMYKEAIEIFEGIYGKDRLNGAAALAYSYARVGKREQALSILKDLTERKERGENIPPQEMAIICMGLEDKDQAFTWLELSYKERFAPLIFLVTDPLFDSLHSDPRFVPLARRLNLIQ